MKPICIIIFEDSYRTNNRFTLSISLNTAFYNLKNDLQSLYDSSEATAIAHELLGYITGLSKYERLLEKETLLSPEQEGLYINAKERLLRGEPLQYVIGVQWFMGREYEVNMDVLIPRQETEELVQWIVNEWEGKVDFDVLDIGTGSGCIPISLKLALPKARITTGDVSDAALQVAERNAVKHDVVLELVEMDFLDEGTWPHLEVYDVIVSNPPYIPMSEGENLDKNVRAYEPGLALFVPDNDPLLFYRKIARFAQTHLLPDGAVYCEVHKAHAYETKVLFEEYFQMVELRKDMNGNERMVKGIGCISRNDHH